MKTIIATALAVILGAGIASAGVIGQQQQQGQGQIQGQKQGQLQGQYQNASPSQTTKFNDERQLAPTFVSPPSFGASVSGNSCAGTEAWSVGLGGAFFVPNGTGAPVSAGVGFGKSSVITINLCEVREAANLARVGGDNQMANQILCQHPAYYRAAQALGRTCLPTEPYEMKVVTEASAAKVVGSGREVASINDQRHDN